MELRHLRYFVAVAEEQSFTRAAARLGIKQPPLSTQIRDLEREVGAPLIRRLTRGLELTESGTVLLEDARRVLDQVKRAKIDAQRRARGATGRVRIGLAGATYFNPVVPTIVRAFRERYPDVVLSRRESAPPEILAALEKGEIDIAFVRSLRDHGDELEIELLDEEPMVIVLPTSHPSARKRSVALAVLAKETFILLERAMCPTSYDRIIASCQRAGFTPRLGEAAPSIPSILPMVYAGPTRMGERRTTVTTAGAASASPKHIARRVSAEAEGFRHAL